MTHNIVNGQITSTLHELLMLSINYAVSPSRLGISSSVLVNLKTKSLDL